MRREGHRNSDNTERDKMWQGRQGLGLSGAGQKEVGKGFPGHDAPRAQCKSVI